MKGEGEKLHAIARVSEIRGECRGSCSGADKKKIASDFGVSVRTLNRWLQEYSDQRRAGIAVPDLAPKKIGRCGAKRKYTEDAEDKILTTIQNNAGKMTTRGAALLTGIPKSTVQRLLKNIKKKRDAKQLETPSNDRALPSVIVLSEAEQSNPSIPDVLSLP